MVKEVQLNPIIVSEVGGQGVSTRLAQEAHRYTSSIQGSGTEKKVSISERIARFGHNVACVFQYLFYQLSRTEASIFSNLPALEGKILLMSEKEKQVSTLYNEALQYNCGSDARVEIFALLMNSGLPIEGKTVFESQQTDDFFIKLFDKIEDIQILQNCFKSALFGQGNRAFVVDLALRLIDSGVVLEERNLVIQSAVQTGSVDLVKKILEKVGEELHLQSPEFVDTAYSKNNAVMLKYLLENKAPCSSDLLQRAYREKKGEMVFLLIEYGPGNIFDQQALELAIEAENEDEALKIWNKMEKPVQVESLTTLASSQGMKCLEQAITGKPSTKDTAGDLDPPAPEPVVTQIDPVEEEELQNDSVKADLADLANAALDAKNAAVGAWNWMMGRS